jgi:3-oxoacyl-(acyl-carrier-protein) synthase
MKQVVVTGMGAVSPAGWGVDALCRALAADVPLEETLLERPDQEPVGVRAVPQASAEILNQLRHPRLRRASPISRYAVWAAREALGETKETVDPETARIGIVYCTTCGCVSYSRRFYQETLDDPSLASPLVFPETVFNAPSSHLSTVLGNGAENYTLAGDAGTVLQGVALAAQLLLRGDLDGCLVVAAEERDWLIGDAFQLFSRSIPVAEGAGALYLTLSDGAEPRLNKITDPFFYGPDRTRESAVESMAGQLAPGNAGEDAILINGVTGSSRLDRPELLAWRHWAGIRTSVKTVMGEGFAAGGMWQVVAGVCALRTGEAKRAIVSLPGTYQFAIGAEFGI